MHAGSGYLYRRWCKGRSTPQQLRCSSSSPAEWRSNSRGAIRRMQSLTRLLILFARLRLACWWFFFHVRRGDARGSLWDIWGVCEGPRSWGVMCPGEVKLLWARLNFWKPDASKSGLEQHLWWLLVGQFSFWQLALIQYLLCWRDSIDYRELILTSCNIY